MVYRSLIGVRVKRTEDPRLITGKGTYTGNLGLPTMGHIAFVRSPCANQRIRSIDTSATLQNSAVLAVVTG